MAKKTNYVWGLEIGQSALKALRCYADGDQIVADMFDFVEYPKILSQPEAEPEKLVADALQQFTSRNDLRGAKVAVSVPGQSGLAKFFKPPPVEVKKIPDIVKYEAKQQIPFDLNDVIWDFQQMAGSNIEDGYALESEVGLFAMKREAVYRALKPFREASIEVDVIQLAPVAVYNMIAFDRFSDRMKSTAFDSDAPPPSIVLLSMGTDASDLVVTNGFRIWQRSIPIGGNHFTRQLVKDLKLTFAKAEHLKRNVMQADDPKLIFQVMRPVFNDLVTEIQRSIGFFRSLNKKAEIESLLMLGATAKLPGLIPFMNKNLGMEVHALDKFERLNGTEVVGQPAFKENQAGFGVVYGLCLQLMQQGPMKTNLLPKEIVVSRLIRAKKPWAIAALSAVLLGMVANYATVYGSFKNVAEERWGDAEKTVSNANSISQSLVQKDAEKKKKLELLTNIGQQLSSNGDRRALWMEMLKTLQEGLMHDPADLLISPTVKPYDQRKEFYVTKIDSQIAPDLKTWFDPLKAKYLVENDAREDLVKGLIPAVEPAAPVDGQPVPPPAVTPQVPPPPIEGPTGPGWVIQLDGYHYYNGQDKGGLEAAAHVRKYLIQYLEFGEIELPGPNGELTKYTLKELGVAFPLIAKPVSMDLYHVVPNPDYISLRVVGSSEESSDEGTAFGTPAKKIEIYKDANGKDVPSGFLAPKCLFQVQFAWKEKTLEDRTWWRAQPTYDRFAIPPQRQPIGTVTP